MNFAPLEKIANAVLYEGFLLYPYRKSAVKNQQPWRFGTLGPEGGPEPCVMQTQCLVEGETPVIEVKVRFLQNEIERDVELKQSGVHHFEFSPIRFDVSVGKERVSAGIARVTVRIAHTGETGLMLSTHTLLGVEGGAFVSLLDPPDRCNGAARDCRNIGTWPVLAGSEGDRHLILSSPIILYDYPRIAPESAGDFFDSSEIDEMLTLRVLTLSEEEKREIRGAADRGSEILARTEMLPPEHLGKLHGAIRSLRRSAQLGFREGDRVRLHPRKKADIFDLVLEGKIAIVEAVEQDFEDRVHLAVTVEDDPGRDLGAARQIGHRFFFSPEEVELV